MAAAAVVAIASLGALPTRSALRSSSYLPTGTHMPAIRNHGAYPRATVAMADDPTASPFVKAVNALQEAIQGQSFAASMKKAIAKMQAGSYDVEATRAKLTNLINETPVLMCARPGSGRELRCSWGRRGHGGAHGARPRALSLPTHRAQALL